MTSAGPCTWSALSSTDHRAPGVLERETMFRTAWQRVGLHLAVSRMDPTGPETTRVHMWVFVTWDEPGGNVALREELNANNPAFFRQGYEEDRVLCEHVQRALEQTQRQAVFGRDEERIPMVHEAWRRSRDGAAR